MLCLLQMVPAAVRHQPRPGESVQDPLQQPQGADGHAQGGQPDHPEGGEAQDRAQQVHRGQRVQEQHQD